MLKKILTVLVFIAAFLVFPKTAFGFGITPAEINVQNLKPGGHYETEIYLTRPVSEDNEILKVSLEPSLGEMDTWFKFLPGKEFDFPSGKNTTTFTVVVDVPQNVDLKNFKGQITAKGTPDKRASEGVTIIKGAVLGVNITTSDVDTLKLKVLSMTAPEVNSGDPVRLLMTIQNSGNTAVAPDKVNLDIMDLFENPKESLSATTLEKIDPFVTKEIQAIFNSNLEKGQYRVDASVTFRGKEIARQKMVLTVNAKPAKSEEQVSQPEPVVHINRSSQAGFILAIIGMLLIIFVSLVYFRLGNVNGSRFGKGVSEFMHKNKIITWFLLTAGVVLVAAGVYQYLLATGPFQKPVVKETSSAGSEKITPTIIPTEVPGKEKVSTESSDVKGVSTKAEETKDPFVVKGPGTPGLYPIFLEPAFDSEILYEAVNGETFDVIRESGEWYNVVLKNGTVGWLHRGSVKKSN
jgi:hypothetical protein